MGFGCLDDWDVDCGYTALFRLVSLKSANYASHSNIHTPTAESTMQRGSEYRCVLLRDTSTQRQPALPPETILAQTEWH